MYNYEQRSEDRLHGSLGHFFSPSHRPPHRLVKPSTARDVGMSATYFPGRGKRALLRSKARPGDALMMVSVRGAEGRSGSRSGAGDEAVREIPGGEEGSGARGEGWCSAGGFGWRGREMAMGRGKGREVRELLTGCCAGSKTKFRVSTVKGTVHNLGVPSN